MVWKVHKSIVWEHVLDEMYHAAYNLVKRLDHEWEENKEVRIVGAFSLQNSYWYILSVAQYQILFGTQMTSSVCFITFLNSRKFPVISVPAPKALWHIFSLVQYLPNPLCDTNDDSACFLTFLSSRISCHFCFCDKTKCQVSRFISSSISFDPTEPFDMF